MTMKERFQTIKEKRKKVLAKTGTLKVKGKRKPQN